MIVTSRLKQWLIDKGICEPDGSVDYYRFNAGNQLAEGKLTPDKLLELTENDDMSNSPEPEKVFGHIRVKDASEKYDETRYAAKHARTGLPVVDPVYQRECTTMSEGSKARAGVFLKHLANRSGLINNPLTEHEQNLLDELSEKHTWCGKLGSEFYDSISGHRNVKALIDDATSGGLEIVPIEFDADVITFPLLHGELFPQVDLKPVPRGRRIEGASVGTPTMTWGGGDDTQISLFDTTSLVDPIDTTIFTIDGAVEVGRDFLSDSPVEVGSVLTALVGERLSSELDKVIANGNGTTQPQGLFQASGVTSINTDNGNGGPPTLDDYITLLFTLGKQYRKAAFRVAFVSNDTTYQRSRSIKIDTATPSTDQRSALSPMMDAGFFNGYSTLGWPHKVQNDLGNAVAGIAALSKYRLYRRLGLEIRWVDGGKELARKNLMLLVYRARFGGRLMDASAFAKWTDGQTT